MLRRSIMSLRRTPLKKKSKAFNSKKQERVDKGKKMMEFFQEIWNDTWLDQRKCIGCNVSLFEPIKTYYFDHLIGKAAHPELAFEKHNIVLVCLNCHSNKEAGFPKVNHQKAIDEAKKLFNI